MSGWNRLPVLALWAASLVSLAATPQQQPGTAALQQARQWVQQGKWSQAEAAFAELEKNGLLTAADLDNALQASRQLNNWERVVALYRLFPLAVNQRIELYEAYLRAGRQADAEAELKKLHSERPGDERLVHLMAFLYLSQNRASDAVSLYGDFLLDHPQAFQSQINLALVHFSLEETAAALDRLGRAYRTNQAQANRYLYRQVVRNMSGMGVGELARLIADIRQELGLAAEGAEAFRILAEEFSSLNRYSPAIEAYQAYLEQRQGDQKARFELARLHFLRGDDAEASASLAPLVGMSGPTADQARLFAAELAVKGGNFEEAGRLLSQLPAGFASQGIHRYLSARVALEGGETERARRLLEEVTQQSPEITEAFLHLGQLYMRLGRQQEGRRLLNEFRQRSQQASQ